MPRVLRALEFYSGIGGLHYASVLFNHLASSEKIYNQEYTDTTDNHDILLPHPDVTWRKSQEDSQDTYPSQKLCQDSRQQPFIDVVESFEINSLANDVYQYNFGRRPHEALIDRITAQQLDAYNADIFLMSPPCQPYTRGGLQKDENDSRASSLHHLLLEVIPNMAKQPQYILLENVQCFESSQSCSFVLSQLRLLGYFCEQFLLSPRQFGIPNQRSRFFLIATKTSPSNSALPASDIISFHIPNNVHFKDRKFASEAELQAWDSPDLAFSRILCMVNPMSSKPMETTIDEQPQVVSSTKEPILIPQKTTPETSIPATIPSTVSRFLCDTTDLSSVSSHDMENYLSTGKDTSNFPLSQNKNHVKQSHGLLLPPSLLNKPSSWCLDIADSHSRSTTCFTKAYSTFIRGSGSVLQTKPQKTWARALTVLDNTQQFYSDTNDQANDSSNLNDSPEFQTPLHERGLRYFDPREVSNIHFFPPSYLGLDEQTPARATLPLNGTMQVSSDSSTAEPSKELDSSNHVAKKVKLSKAERILQRSKTFEKPKTNLCDNRAAFGDNFMCFSFPPHITFKQRHKMLGNSLNVYVVSQLLLHMLRPEFETAQLELEGSQSI